MSLFKLHSEYKPGGDQPKAIKELLAGLEAGEKSQMLLGITGSGKTFTMANVIAASNSQLSSFYFERLFLILQ